jgi:ketosteroid isomerase-like protein
MTTPPNEDLVRAASAAFGRGDLGALQDQFFAENIVWHVAGTSPIAGDYEGVAQAMGLLGRISELSGGTAQHELHDVLVSADPRGRARHAPRPAGGQAASGQHRPCHPRRKRQGDRDLD